MNKHPEGEIKQAREIVRRIIADYFGSKPSRIIHQTSGQTNFVFSAIHAEGNFVIRLSFDHTQINSFIKEQWVQEKVHEIGIPTAEILEVGNDNNGYPFMISRTVKGCEATFHPARLQILQELGNYASLINTIPTHGFGDTFDWSGNQLSHNETFADFLEEELDLEARFEFLEKKNMIAPEQIKKMRSIFKQLVKSEPKSFLNHGDLRLKNLITDEKGTIKAILDWEKSISNIAPQWELSIALHDLSIDEKQIFLEGYGISEKKLREISPVFKALNIINYTAKIKQLVNEKNTAQLEHFRTRLTGVLDLYCL